MKGRVSDKSTKQAVERLADGLGVTIGRGHREITMEAPDGWIFSGPRTHGVVARKWDDQPMEDCWKASLADLRDGLEPCNTPDCETCEGE